MKAKRRRIITFPTSWGRVSFYSRRKEGEKVKTNKSVGNYYEKRSIKYLERMGYTCERTRPKVIWIKGKPISLHADFFGCADIIAVRKTDIAFVQVKFRGENTRLNMKAIKNKFEKLPNTTCECGKPVLIKALHIWELNGHHPFVELF